MAINVNDAMSNLLALNYLGKNTAKQSSALAKLSSGYSINKASDNPSGLVISEKLRSQISSINQASQNTQAAYNTMSIAEGGLSGISDTLSQMRTAALQALNSGVTDSSQVSALQSQVDSGLSTISNAVESTKFSGQKLLNGAQAINYSLSDTNNILNADATSLTQVSANTSAVAVDYAGGTANQAEKAYLESSTVSGGTLSQDVSFNLNGNQGSQTFSFSAGASLSDIADTINNASSTTGVNAYSINGGTGIRLVSSDYGSDQRVMVEETAGSLFAAQGATATDYGQDATVQINGATTTTNGLTATVGAGGISGTFTFNEGTASDTTIAQTGYDQDTLTNATAPASADLTNISGGMTLQTGTGSSDSQVAGIKSMSLSNLGNVTVNGESYNLSDLASGGDASLASNPSAALKVIDQAISDVATQRASIGAYQSNTLQSNLNYLSIAAENLTATESAISDTDFAEMVTEYIQSQLQTKTTLAAITSANTNAKNVMHLLGSSLGS